MRGKRGEKRAHIDKKDKRGKKREETNDIGKRVAKRDTKKGFRHISATILKFCFGRIYF
jgi:hypothetical protein